MTTSEMFTLQHIDISDRFQSTSYRSNNINAGGAGIIRSREKHGSRLTDELASAYKSCDARSEDYRLGKNQGVFIEIELISKAKIELLEQKSHGIFPSSFKPINDKLNSVGLFVPNDKRQMFEEILYEYTWGQTTKKGRPKRQKLVEAIESIRDARFETYWTDSKSKLPKRGEKIWWEVWCFRGYEDELIRMANILGVQILDEDNWLKFHEHVVVPLFTNQVTLELMLFNRLAISELRRADDTPHFYLNELNPVERLDFVTEFAERVEWPKYNAPAVCLLDTGVNRNHKLIEAAMAPEDLDTVANEWGVADLEGHGTQMAGLALFGNLTPKLAQTEKVELKHRLESVRYLPPENLMPTEEKLYGSVTKRAISLPEIANPKRSRVFCLAITNRYRTGIKPTGWSSAIDQLASGSSTETVGEPKRLIVVATGNAPDFTIFAEMNCLDNYEIEDPAQAWNALTVGGVTYLAHIDEMNLKNYSPLVEPGEVSPFSRTSSNWPAGKTPRKPDIVMEAGNRAVSPGKVTVLNTDSLGLLTTSASVNDEVLSHIVGTSASVALVSRLIAQLISTFPKFWPETIRALVIHSSEWTGKMREAIKLEKSKSGRTKLLRCFGYGVPNLKRAVSSAQNSLAMISQAEIQPFKPKGGMNECHYYSLPWPKQELEALGAENLKLKVTLSYFIEPNPGTSAAIDPYRYQSYGLRFELKRILESTADFYNRTNKILRDKNVDKSLKPTTPDNWLFGKQSMTAGYLHCDVWTGTGLDLLNCNLLCVKPVGGWWNNRTNRMIRGRKARYALILTLESPHENLNLHAPISKIVKNKVEIIPITMESEF